MGDGTKKQKNYFLLFAKKNHTQGAGRDPVGAL
jgi:hypothetical protein